MSINRVNFGEAQAVHGGDRHEVFLARMIIEQSLEMLEPGEYDLTPDSWRDVYHTLLYVEDETCAVLVGDPQTEDTDMAPYTVWIPEEHSLVTLKAHKPDETATHLYGAVFYLPESIYE